MTISDEKPVMINDLVDFMICCMAIDAAKEKAKRILERNPKLAKTLREIVEKYRI